MRNILGGNLYRVIVVAGILLLIGLISADIWLWQRDDGSGQSGTGQGAQEGLELPGLPARNTAGGTDPGDVSSGASASDSAEVEIRRGGAAAGEVEIIQIEGTSGAGSESIAGGSEATVDDSAGSEVEQEQAPAPSGGPTDAAGVGSSADVVVRDAAGNIKQQETVK